MIRPHVPGLGTEWSRVLIHGVPCSRERCPEFPDVDTALRVTWISDKWQPFTTAIRLTRLEHQIPPRKAWVAGECQKPRFERAAEQFPDKDVFFNLACTKTEIALSKVNFNPVVPAAAVTMFDEPKRDRPVYRSPWLWAGIGTAVAILVVQSQQKQEKKDPSTSYGY